MKMGLFPHSTRSPEAGSAEPVSIRHSRPRDQALSPSFASSARWLSSPGSSPSDSKGAASTPGRKDRGGAGVGGGWAGAPRSQKPEAVPENTESVYVSLIRMGSRGPVAARGSGKVSISAGRGATLDRAQVLMHGRDKWTLRRQPPASATLFFTAQLSLHPC